MKVIYNIALWPFVVTLGLHCLTLFSFLMAASTPNGDVLASTGVTLIFGFISQIVLGVIHIVLAFVVYADFKSLIPTEKLMINSYSILVILFFIGWYFVSVNELVQNSDSGVALMAVAPMIIGAFFVMALYLIQKRIKQQKQTL